MSAAFLLRLVSFFRIHLKVNKKKLVCRALLINMIDIRLDVSACLRSALCSNFDPASGFVEKNVTHFAIQISLMSQHKLQPLRDQ